jgi:Spy/CpxP family protein refolding chaperone
VRKSRVEALLIGLTVLALCAGVVAGIVYARLPSAGSAVKPDNTPPPPMLPPDGPGEKSLADELQLTAEQRVQMRDIWEGVRDKVHQAFDEAQDLQRQRDERIVALLSTDEQKAKFQKLSQEFADRYDQLAKDRDEAFNSAVEKTKKLLTDEQRKKYEQILKTHVRPGPPADARGRKMIIASPPNPATSQPVK